jgi:beta-mannosidase
MGEGSPNESLQILLLVAIVGLAASLALAAEANPQPSAEPTLWQPYRITPRVGEQHISLDGPWQLCHRDAAITGSSDLAKQDKWIPATVPTSVQWALHRAGLLPHPYEHLNSKQYSWVDEKVWYYRKTVDIPAVASGQLVFLSFDGIDYFARVWFNGKLLGRHEGMFGGPVAEVGELLRPGQPNEIVVEVKAANFGNKKDFTSRRLGPIIKPWVLAGGVGAEAFFPLGMWQSARIDIVPAAHLERPFLVTRSADSQQATLSLSVELFDGSHSLKHELHSWKNKATQPVDPFRNAWMAKPASAKFTVVVRLEEKATGRLAAQETFTPETIAGRNAVKHSFQFACPKLWWPNGMGESPLYRVKLTLLADGSPVDRLEFDYGIRTVQTVPTAGTPMPDRFANWQFVVNGRPLFVKGMNWMPADILLDLPAERYRWLLGMARNQGVQLIRIWGGGLLETEEFYAACNELGLMVWQDFPVGNQDTPDWPQDVWEAQVMHNIFRLRNHPALVLYCGGNEFNPYSFGNAATIGIVERNVALFDSTRVWRRTTPDEGSLHVYPNMDPTWYATTYRYIPYIAETGIHNIPDPRSMREVVDPAEFARPLSGMLDKNFPKEHPDLMHHFVEYQASRVPQMLSKASHIDDMNAPTLEALAEGTQIGGGEFYQIVSDVMQANWPVTSGLMPWVFKRPWPVIAIMLVDGLGHPTAPYYFLKRTYEPTHVAVKLPELLWAKGESLPIRAAVIHAPPTTKRLQLSVEILDPALKRVWQQRQWVNAMSGPSVENVELGSFRIPDSFEEHFFFVVAELRNARGRLVSRSVYWPRCLARMSDEAFRTKYRASPQPTPIFDKGPWLKPQVAAIPTSLDASLVEVRDASPDRSRVVLRVRNTGDQPAVNVRVDIAETRCSYYGDDNFFWLAPGESRDLAFDVLWREPATRGAARLGVSAWNAGRKTLPLAAHP